MLKKKEQGFTLIELLVVIAIIGILSSVVLASLNTAREKGNQAALTSNLKTIQVQAELYYDGTGNQTYGVAKLPTAVCSAGMFGDATINSALLAASSSGSGTTLCAIGVNGQTWSASVQYKDATAIWCTDSTGYAGTGKPTATMALIGDATSCQ